MISNITIENFKSVLNVSLPLGRFNLLIGANGCGKSNILEGIAIGAAASSDKLDYEYFSNRGIRVVEPRFMLPAFEDTVDNLIQICVANNEGHETVLDIRYDKNAKPARWVNDNEFDMEEDAQSDDINQTNNKEDKDDVLKFVVRGNKLFAIPTNADLNTFLIYSLEESKLRRADDFNEIKENLKILDWFDDMQVPSGQLSMEFNLKLKDGYLSDTINTFDQRSTNEGFLYLLFYLTLVISDETPKFFAIENIDTAFNPKLCREVVRRLIELARKHDKQIIATSHNAAVLDGMNLFEDDVRLHVVRRTIDGYTKTNRVILKDNMSMPLSEAWMKGLIGGLPDNF